MLSPKQRETVRFLIDYTLGTRHLYHASGNTISPLDTERIAEEITVYIERQFKLDELDKEKRRLETVRCKNEQNEKKQVFSNHTGMIDVKPNVGESK